MGKDFIDKILCEISNGDNIKKFDLSKTEDLTEYIETCEKLRSYSLLKTMFTIFNEDYDEFIDNLKTLGYKKYNESRAETEKQENDTCECEDCMCGTCIDMPEIEHWDYDKNIKIGDYGIALDEKHFPIYMGKVTYNDDLKFTLKSPVKFENEDCTDIEKLPFDEMTLVKSLWTLDKAMDDEIAIYEGNDPFADIKYLPSHGLRVEVLDDISTRVQEYMDKNPSLFEDEDAEFVYDILFEYTAYLYKNDKL